MGSILRTLLPLELLRAQARAQGTRLAAFVLAAFLGIVALFYLLDAAVLGMVQVMPAWAASLVVGACLVIAAGLACLGGMVAGRRQDRRALAIAAATPAAPVQLAAIATPLVMQILRHPRQLVLIALAAGALSELLRKR